MRLAVLAAWGAISGLSSLIAAPTVTNVAAVQRAGTNLVEITYDVDAASPPVFVRIAVSDNGGSTYSTVASHCTGDVGQLATTGTGKKVVWDAGADWKAKLTKNMRFKIMANDAVIPEGFALIPAGSFEMGDALGDNYPEELPVHSVHVSAFYIEKTEVLKSTWDQVYSWAVANGYGFDNAGAGKAANHPVQTVNWYDAVKWCNARSEMEGLKPCYTSGTAGSGTPGAVYRRGQDRYTMCDWAANGYRLPTEAEWEKAARGGQNGKRFPWGDTITHTRANYYSSTGYSYDVSPTRGSHPTYNTHDYPNSPYTNPTNAFVPNEYGLYDVVGNVVEWCWDWNSSTYYSSSPATDPTGPSNGSSRVVRGGDWSVSGYRCRISYRKDWNFTPVTSYFTIGFRCVRR